jgi:hypothetical protein
VLLRDLALISVKRHIIEMIAGPGTLRFFVQPAIAIVLGILHGIRDCRGGRPPYLIGLIRARGARGRHLLDGARAIALPLCLALVGAYLFEYVIRGRIYVFYGLLYALLFVAVPYVVTRALANRFASRRITRTPTHASSAML